MFYHALIRIFLRDTKNSGEICIYNRMLRAKALTPLLAQLNGAGVKASMVLAPDGRLLCYTSVPDLVETDRLIGSVAALAFSEYRGACRAGFEPPAEADFLSVELEVRFCASMVAKRKSSATEGTISFCFVIALCCHICREGLSLCCR